MQWLKFSNLLQSHLTFQKNNSSKLLIYNSSKLLIKPKLLTALNEESFLSDLHKQLDEKSKYMRFNDLIAYHPTTPFDYNFKEKFACLASQWYDEYSDAHKRDYPLTVLLPVIL